jgi:hypothetical protein
MDPHSKNILKTVRWASFVVTVLTAVAFFLFGDDARLQRWAGLGERVFILSLVGLFSYVLVALAWQFASDLKRPGDAATSGVLLELRSPRGAAALAMVGAGLLVAAGFSVAFVPKETLDGWNVINPFAGMPFHELALFGLFGAIGAFLAIAFAVRTLVNPPWFLLTREGFFYAPGGVSAGLVRWSDVKDIRESQVLSSGRAGRRGPTMQPTLVVTLKSPDRYVARYTPMLRLLVRATTAVLRAQTRGGDIYLDPSHFGDRYPEITAKMRELAGLAEPG